METSIERQMEEERQKMQEMASNPNIQDTKKGIFEDTEAEKKAKENLPFDLPPSP